MAQKKYEHFFLNNQAEALAYKSKKQRGSEWRLPPRDRIPHAQRLLSQFDTLWASEGSFKAQRQALSIKVRGGAYVQFTSGVDADLLTKSLEDVSQGIRLLNIKQEQDGKVVKATVYVPAGKENYFVKKIERYRTEETKTGKPKNANLVNSIEDIQGALLEALWTDPVERIPAVSTPSWVECWLRISDDGELQKKEINDFVALLQENRLESKPNYLIFPERAVLLINASKTQLSQLLSSCDILAEFRIGQEACGFWVNEGNKGQSEWVEDLLSRLQISTSNVKVCILDSGVNQGHKLLEPVLVPEDCLSVDPLWGSDDHESRSGHGTLMAGVIAYGELEQALLSTEKINVSHKLCSVKILPRVGRNKKELYGDITKQAISRAEIRNPDLFVLYCMAVTTSEDIDRGRPSSWSGAIDELAYGNGKKQRLILISAGNVEETDWPNYPASNLVTSVQNPAQSWNALTVGAFTEKSATTDPKFLSATPVAPSGALSPFSTTSRVWARKWPIKPEVVFEGGNLLKESSGDLYPHEDLSVLSTSKDLLQRQFDVFNATSAATAQASWFAAQIAVRYPTAWPETIRGLMAHSSEWSPAMVRQAGNGLQTRSDYAELMRVFGYGKPNLSKALYSSESAFTMVLQESIQPFEKVGSNFKMKDMHFYKLPWPKDVLLALGEMNIRLRATLSYFIQPGVGEIGWKDKYRYQSYGLRFDLNDSTEDEETFKKRINIAVRAEDEDASYSSGSARWIIGDKNRRVGSLHSDIWEGTAAQMASCNMMAVYPIIGWWRERHNLHRANSKARYSLIVSLETPPIDTDIYSVVAAAVRVPVEVQVGTNGRANP